MRNASGHEDVSLQGKRSSLVHVAEQYRMKPPVTLHNDMIRYHESKEIEQILSRVGTSEEENCRKALARLMDRKRTIGNVSIPQQHSIEESLGIAFAEHVGMERRRGSYGGESLAKEASQALKTVVSIVAPPGSSRNFTNEDYVKALGALVVSFEKKGRIDVDSALNERTPGLLAGGAFRGIMSDYSRDFGDGIILQPTDGRCKSLSFQDNNPYLNQHADDGMADTASSNVPTNQNISSTGIGRSSEDGNALQALCQEINATAEESRMQHHHHVGHKRNSHLKPRNTNEQDVIPSGKRKQGEGCEDDQQGILEAFWNHDGRAVLRITLLAAGFVIGPKGQSIRDISDVSGAKIRSWSENFVQYGKMRRVRQIVVEGHVSNIVHALTIIKHAVARYRELYEGRYCNQFVDPIQMIMGVEFTYSPPPRKAVPYAAGIRTKGTRDPSARRHDQRDDRKQKSHGLLPCINDSVTDVSSESDQSYQHMWSRDVTREEPHISVRDDDMLGLFEVPCDVYQPRSLEYHNPPTYRSEGPQHPANTYSMFGSQNQGYLRGYPWFEVNMLEDATVQSLDKYNTQPHVYTKSPVLKSDANPTKISYRDAVHDSGNLFSSYGYQQPCRNQSDIWDRKPSPRSTPRSEKHVYDNMFAEFGHKCHVADKNSHAVGCRGDHLNLTPHQKKIGEQVSPVHFTFEVTLDSKPKEARRKLVFEE